MSNLVSNLRGEVGDIVFTWVLMQSLSAQAWSERSGDLDKDLGNSHLAVLDALTDKLEDEVVARLSELAQPKIGQLTFHFASVKLQALEADSAEFARFISGSRFHAKRNNEISHKELPEKWTDHRTIHIPYSATLKAIAMALRLMKRIDALYLGPRAKYLWCEMRRRRYRVTYPARVAYMLLPYLWLKAQDRAAIINEEMDQGLAPWKEMRIKLNGIDTSIMAYGEMGALILGGRLVLLDQSFIELASIDLPPPSRRPAHAPLPPTSLGSA